ncbi:flagellar basal body-associated FliL family protein [Erwinia oleae]|uniref:flagellar basal body-associated FliL family protein n=1 Tax=Erwinia oleae TaxID=796334 RepID=UPI0005555AFC|nr:flagellar basal body-associated FliL family protein [Erwinia oleae]
MKILINVLIALVTSVFTAVLVVVANHYLTQQTAQDKTTLFSFFSSNAPEEITLHFVEIKDQVITLKSNSHKERYLLLDMALTARDEPMVLKTENMLPKIKGITVDVLSTMEYQQVRNMSVSDLRDLLMAEYKKCFKNMGVAMPFDDVTLSKMVFQ